MKAVLQRVSRAEVRVAGESVGRIGAGLLILLGVLRGDTERELERLVEKVARQRCFADERGRMNRSALEVGAAVLVVSQVTLAADGRKGLRPSLDRAAPPAEAERLYLAFAARLGALGLVVQTGRFGTAMEVELVNDGPLTLILEASLPGPPAGPTESSQVLA